MCTRLPCSHFSNDSRFLVAFTIRVCIPSPTDCHLKLECQYRVVISLVGHVKGIVFKNNKRLLFLDNFLLNICVHSYSYKRSYAVNVVINIYAYNIDLNTCKLIF